ncbi:phasin family domain protein [Collimonas arenae]|uniref:Phasin family domain protein n=2 Tax=Collimonas arenae TaxID=279058 RepID=A0A127QJ26_9BURK|nr:phasin family domain protein [Collimonas arenae]
MMKTACEAQFAAMAELTEAALDGMVKATNLNLDAMKASMTASANASQQMMSATTPQEWLLLRSAQMRPAAEQACHYGHHMADIVSCTQAEMLRGAATHAAKTVDKMHALSTGAK